MILSFPTKKKKKLKTDGRNPVPVDMENIPFFIGFHRQQVVQDVFHQQCEWNCISCESYSDSNDLTKSLRCMQKSLLAGVSVLHLTNCGYKLSELGYYNVLEIHTSCPFYDIHVHYLVLMIFTKTLVLVGTFHQTTNNNNKISTRWGSIKGWNLNITQCWKGKTCLFTKPGNVCVFNPTSIHLKTAGFLGKVRETPHPTGRWRTVWVECLGSLAA